jgi:hypothetical protein
MWHEAQPPQQLHQLHTTPNRILRSLRQNGDIVQEHNQSDAL